MQEITMLPIPRQSLSIVLNNNRWGLHVYEITGGMACDVTLNDVLVISGVRAVAGRQILPYRYQTIAGGGNFAFKSADNNTKIPWYEDFGVTCSLIYATTQEIEA